MKIENEDELDNLIICRQCFTLHEKVPLQDGSKACCSECGSVLYRYDSGLVNRGLALSISGFIFFVIANAFPLVKMDILGNEQIGQWFEVRPAQGSWPGVMFGVAGAEIAFHGVGPAGSLPSKTILNYPMQGLKLEMGKKAYLAWAAQNELNAETSYFVKVEGYPESILFGPYSTEQEADVFVLGLK